MFWTILVISYLVCGFGLAFIMHKILRLETRKQNILRRIAMREKQMESANSSYLLIAA